MVRVPSSDFKLSRAQPNQIHFRYNFGLLPCYFNCRAACPPIIKDLQAKLVIICIYCNYQQSLWGCSASSMVRVPSSDFKLSRAQPNQIHFRYNLGSLPCYFNYGAACPPVIKELQAKLVITCIYCNYHRA